MKNIKYHDIIAKMTVREKIGQTSQECLSDFLTWDNVDISELLIKYPLGSIFIGSDVIGQQRSECGGIATLLNRCNTACKIQLSVAGDVENGAGSAIDGMTVFPSQMCLGATDSEEMAYEFGRLTAIEATKSGFNWTFGPVADLAINWLSPSVGVRSLGSNASKVVRLISALIRGYQDYGLSACVKHFPGDGTDFRDQHLVTAINSMNKKTWYNSYGKIYDACFSAGVRSLMVGHIALPWFDESLGRGGRPRPASVSHDILTTLLREQMGFNGVVVSDALIMAGFTGWDVYEQRILSAVNAGVDIMLWPGKRYFSLMEQALEDGRLTMDRLNQMVLRILKFKDEQGILNTNSTVIPQDSEPEYDAMCFAKDLAQKGITLVRNKSNALPLDRQKHQKMLLLFATPLPDKAHRTLAPMLEELHNRNIDVFLKVNGNCLDLCKLQDQGYSFDVFLSVWHQNMHSIKNTLRPSGEMAECLWMQQVTHGTEPIIISMGTPYLLNEMPYADTLINIYGADESSQRALIALLYGENEFKGTSPVNTGGEWIIRNMNDNVDCHKNN